VSARTIQLGEVCEFVYGDSLKEDRRRTGKVPVFGSNGIVGWHDRAITSGPTIVIGRKGSIGEVNWSNEPCFPIDTTYFVDKTKRPCDLRWLYFTLLKLDLTRFNKSAAVPGLNREDAYEQQIPWLDLPDQKRIARLLEQADRLRRTRRYALEPSDFFHPATFIELFGDPERNTKGWDRVEFATLGALDRGRSKHRPRNAPHLYGGRYPLFRRAT
jgi:type I restriction enzyme, S subunit